MARSKAIGSMQRKREQMRTLGALAPQFSVALDTGLGSNAFYLHLPLRRSWLFIGIAGAFLIAFSLPLFSIGGPFFERTDDSLFDLIFVSFSAFWLLGWSAGVAVLALVFLVLLLGRETLRVNDNKLTLRMGIPGIGFGASYDASLLRNFRQETAASDEGNSWRGEHLAFDYAGEPVHFGSTIDSERAQSILRQLARLFPEQETALPDLSALTASADHPEAPAPFQPETTHSGIEKDAAVSLRSISAIALIIANLIPLIGVLLDDWRIGEIMLLFWAESAVIGFYNLCKMWRVGRWSLLFYGPFFVGHYGAFMAGHLLFIYGFFSSGFGNNGDITTGDVWADFLRLWPALLGFCISHGVSFTINYLGRREYVGKDMGKQMGEPYRRIIIMHVTIILGGFLVMLFGTALPALMMLIVLKVMADLRGHLQEHSASV